MSCGAGGCIPGPRSAARCRAAGGGPGRGPRPGPGPGAGEPAVPGDDLPGPRLRPGCGDDQGHQDPMLPDARHQVVDLGGRVAVKRKAEGIWPQPLRADADRFRGESRVRNGGHGRGHPCPRGRFRLAEWPGRLAEEVGGCPGRIPSADIVRGWSSGWLPGLMPRSRSGFGMDAAGDPGRMGLPIGFERHGTSCRNGMNEAEARQGGPACRPCATTRPIGRGRPGRAVRGDGSRARAGSCRGRRGDGVASRARTGAVPVGRGAGEERGGEPAAAGRRDRPGRCGPLRDGERSAAGWPGSRSSSSMTGRPTDRRGPEGPGRGLSRAEGGGAGGRGGPVVGDGGGHPGGAGRLDRDAGRRPAERPGRPGAALGGPARPRRRAGLAGEAPGRLVQAGRSADGRTGCATRVLGQSIRDTGCSVRIFPREVALRLPVFRGVHRFFGPLLLREGCRLVQVPVGHRPRPHGRSHYNLWNRSLQVVVDLLGVAWLLRRPLRYRVVRGVGRRRRRTGAALAGAAGSRVA